VLLSLRHEYMQLIRDGIKHYEYRREYCNDRTLAFVYETTPVNAVTAVLELDKPLVGLPDEIADLAERHQPGAGDSIRSYLHGRRRGFAIPIRDYREVGPVSRAELLQVEPRFRPPQSYVLLSKRPELQRLLTERTHDGD
jgi:predicted transcriptional regulator